MTPVSFEAKMTKYTSGLNIAGRFRPSCIIQAIHKETVNNHYNVVKCTCLVKQ
jgi:hypothetical protein